MGRDEDGGHVATFFNRPLQPEAFSCGTGGDSVFNLSNVKRNP
jgi:hypothetical protein